MVATTTDTCCQTSKPGHCSLKTQIVAVDCCRADELLCFHFGLGTRSLFCSLISAKKVWNHLQEVSDQIVSKLKTLVDGR